MTEQRLNHKIPNKKSPVQMLIFFRFTKQEKDRPIKHKAIIMPGGETPPY